MMEYVITTCEYNTLIDTQTFTCPLQAMGAVLQAIVGTRADCIDIHDNAISIFNQSSPISIDVSMQPRFADIPY